MRLTTPAVAIVLLSALVLSGCHSMTRVALPDSTPPPSNAAVFAHLKAGDDIRVTMQTGEKVTFELAEVQTEGLVARGGRHIPFRDIAQIEKRYISWTKIGILTGSILAYLAYFVTHF
jgi:hypothetical protein